MKAYVINLPECIERSAFMRAQMEGAGLDWEFWPATDAREVRVADYPGWLSGRYLDCPWMSKAAGTQACSLSHVRLWHYLAALPPADGFAFIFEDDVEVRSDFLPRWLEQKSELPEDWDVVHFSPWNTQIFDERGRHSPHFHRHIRCEIATNAHSYALNTRRLTLNLPKILPLTEEFDLHVGHRLAALKIFLHGKTDPVTKPVLGIPSIRLNLDQTS